MTLRARVAAAAAAAIVLALALLVIAVPKLLADDLRGELDDSLRRRAADVARLNATAPAELTSPGAIEGGGAARAGRGPLRADRRALQRARRAGRSRSTSGCCATASRGSPTGGSAPTRVRLYSAPLGELGRGEAAGGAVVVASDLAAVERTLDRTRRADRALRARGRGGSRRRSPRC